MNQKISILCPTRERARRARDYYYQLARTAQHPEDVEILFYIDNDDPQLVQYQQLFYETDPIRQILSYTLVIGEPISVSKSWNILAEKCTGDILLMGNDDLYPRTAGWDTKLREVDTHYEDKIYCAFFDDGINAGKHCAFPAVSRLWYNAVGYFTPGIFEFAYNDTWIFDLGKRINRVHYLPDVLVEHQHWTKTKVKDATTKRHRDDTNGLRLKRDKELYEKTYHLRERDAEKLQQYIMK